MDTPKRVAYLARSFLVLLSMDLFWDDHQLPRCLNSMPTLDGVRSMEGRKMTAAQVATLRIELAKRQGGEHSDIVDPYRNLYYIGAFALVRHSVQTRQVWPQPWRDVSPHCLEVDFEEHGWSCKWQRNRRRNCLDSGNHSMKFAHWRSKKYQCFHVNSQ